MKESPEVPLRGIFVGAGTAVSRLCWAHAMAGLEMQRGERGGCGDIALRARAVGVRADGLGGADHPAIGRASSVCFRGGLRDDGQGRERNRVSSIFGGDERETGKRRADGDGVYGV